MSDTPLTLMQTVKPISAQNRYKPIWHNPQTVAVRALRDTWTRWLLRVCSQLRIRCAHNHSIRRHSVITFLAVNKLNRLLSPKYCFNVYPCITRRFLEHTSVYCKHISCKHEITTCYDVARRLSTCENEPVALQIKRFDSIKTLLIFKRRRLMGFWIWGDYIYRGISDSVAPAVFSCLFNQKQPCYRQHLCCTYTI